MYETNIRQIIHFHLRILFLLVLLPYHFLKPFLYHYLHLATRVFFHITHAVSLLLAIFIFFHWTTKAQHLEDPTFQVAAIFTQEHLQIFYFKSHSIPQKCFQQFIFADQPYRILWGSRDIIVPTIRVGYSCFQ